MTGIYKITNNLNGNAYIGLSIDIEARWKSHKARYNSTQEYDKALYKAFRAYGVDNFTFEILEECEAEDLPIREKYWIAYYDTYKHGYNMTPGGEGQTDIEGEKHPNHKLTEADVIYIRQLWASKTVSTREMYYEFQNRIGKSGFKKIYTWQTWKKILPELNTQENRDWHRNNKDSYTNPVHPCNKINDAEVLKIKERRKNDEAWMSIYEDYKHLYASCRSFSQTISKRMERL